jgi:hypothetical protein
MTIVKDGFIDAQDRKHFLNLCQCGSGDYWDTCLGIGCHTRANMPEPKIGDPENGPDYVHRVGLKVKPGFRFV